MGLDEVADLYDAWCEKVKREDYRAGVIASLLVNINTDPKKHAGPPAMPGDYFPSLAREYEPPSEEELEAKLHAAFGTSGA